jgi:hypothetical protein
MMANEELAQRECVVYWLFDAQCVCVGRHGYVGITTGLKKRLERHRRNKSFPTFDWKILFRGPSFECRRFEYQLRPVPSIGWNIGAGGGQARLGHKSTATARRNMSDAGKKRAPASQETREKLRAASTGRTNRGRLGQKKSIEERAKIAAGHRGVPESEEFRQKLSARMIGKKHHLGHSHTSETKERIRMKKLGVPIHSEEEKRKRAERWKGNTLTKGKPWSAARRLAQLKRKEK